MTFHALVHPVETAEDWLLAQIHLGKSQSPSDLIGATWSSSPFPPAFDAVGLSLTPASKSGLRELAGGPVRDAVFLANKMVPLMVADKIGATGLGIPYVRRLPHVSNPSPRAKGEVWLRPPGSETGVLCPVFGATLAAEALRWWMGDVLSQMEDHSAKGLTSTRILVCAFLLYLRYVRHPSPRKEGSALTSRLVKNFCFSKLSGDRETLVNNSSATTRGSFVRTLETFERILNYNCSKKYLIGPP